MGLAVRRQGARRRCGFIVDDERRGMRPQSPCALRVPAAWGRLLRYRASTMLRHRTSSRRLASGPTASGTRPGPILGQAPGSNGKEVIEMNRVLHRLLPVALMAIPA